MQKISISIIYRSPRRSVVTSSPSRLLLVMMLNHDEDDNIMAKAMLIAAVVTLVACTMKTPPYGRYSKSIIFGIRFPLINAKLAWMVMECPNVAMAVWCWAHSSESCRRSLVNLLLLFMFEAHYINRSFVFSLRTRGGRPMPALMTAFSFSFCSYNGYMQSSYLLYSHAYPDSWLWDPRFLTGAIVFAIGYSINYQSDDILRNLRGPGQTGYSIPRGGLFEYVSAANYFGESLEWCGFAIAGWSWEGWAFAVYTLSNLAPRAYHHHKWYLDKFKEEYPSKRKALIPFLW